MVDEELDHGRHEQRVGDAVLGDRRQDGAGIERGEDHVGAAGRQGDPPGGHVGQVEHGRRPSRWRGHRTLITCAVHGEPGRPVDVLDPASPGEIHCRAQAIEGLPLSRE
jgi:hypothetical protein